MRHKRTKFDLLAVCMLMIGAVLIVEPAVASAKTVWVSNTESVKAPFNSCKNPSYSSIQSALAGPSTVIYVCPGTYAEQLQINRSITITGEPNATIALPPSPVASTSACAAAGEQDLIGICAKASETITLSHLTFEAYWPEGTCNENLYGINVGGGAELAMNHSTMLGAGAKPLDGCQGGVGVQIGRNYTGQVATAEMYNDEISGYQKNGITVDNSGSHAIINKVTVTGAGPAPIAQNGIQVSRGAVATLASDTISKNECDVSSCGDNGSYLEYEEDAAGVLFYKEGAGSNVTKSHIKENDLGVSHIAEEETTTPQASIKEDVLEGNRYAGVMLGQGYAGVGKDIISGGAVGILLLQYVTPLEQEWPTNPEFGPRGTGNEDTISGTSKHAIEGVSDKNPYDQFGSFTSTNSKISGNPGTVAESVYTNNPKKLKIITSGDS